MATEFTLADLKANKITYKHDGSETTQDQFRFIVTDGSHRDFYLFPELKKTHEGSVTFPIKIVPVDDERPRVIVNRTMTYVTENPDGSRTARLTNKHLRSSDRDSYNPELKLGCFYFRDFYAGGSWNETGNDQKTGNFRVFLKF